MSFQSLSLPIQTDAMEIGQKIIITTVECLRKMYSADIQINTVSLTRTRKEFQGDFTLNVFPLIKMARVSPEKLADEIGTYLMDHLPDLSAYNIVKGFLNLSVNPAYWTDFLKKSLTDEHFGITPTKKDRKPVMIEYSSPNTNKPLHLGHIRNNLLGFSISKILEANGENVVMVNLINDRGIHICKSMLAWQKWGNAETPETNGVKGDRLVGDFYVAFDKAYKQEIAILVSSGATEKEAENNSQLMKEVREMLQKWEAGDEEVRDLWQRMNNWVYAGFDRTYQRMGIHFHKMYYESETYLLGKEIIAQGLKNEVFYQKEDGSVWVDLTDRGLDEKILLRSDGTSVYITQDIGTAVCRYNELLPEQMIYVVGNEQNYHFQVLQIILEKLGYAWAKEIHHFSYGMVELPHGRMKSREGTVVDADDLLDEVVLAAERMVDQSNKLEGMPPDEKRRTCEIIGLGALKYFILKVDPKKKMLFNPEESVSLQGDTGPFVQYSYARTRSVMRKAEGLGLTYRIDNESENCWNSKEIELIKTIHAFSSVVKEAGAHCSPALIANFIYDLAKEYNQYYQEHKIILEEDKVLSQMRLALTFLTGRTIKTAMGLLGIEVPEKM